MAEIYTLSGPMDEFGAAVTPLDQTCARNVAPSVILGAGARIGSVGVGLFGTYKLLKGKGAAGVVGLLGAGVLWFAGGALMKAAAAEFEDCRKA